MKKLDEKDYCIDYFGITFDTRKTRMFLSRDNYAKIDKKGFENDRYRKNILNNWDYFEKLKEDKTFDFDISNRPPALKYEKIEDELFLTDDFCNEYHNACMKNYDLNMKFISELDDNEFNNVVNKLLEDNVLVEIKDLDSCKGKKGIYIMVLDDYKQIYVGQSSRDIRERILRHWKKKPYFDKVLFGKAINSVISIDSFGVCDTTRIYVMYIYENSLIDDYERNLVNSVPKKFSLNRIGGGIHLSNGLDFLEAILTTNKREL